MRFQVSSALLSSRLQNIGRVIESKNTASIMQCFKFEIQGTKLTITASDNEIMMHSFVELNYADSDATFAINAKIIQDAFKEIPDQPIEFTLDEATMEVKINYLNGCYNLMAESAETYPVFQNQEDAQTVTLPIANLLNGITRALFACSQDKNRLVLSGIYFDIKSNEATLIASDGFKLACSKFFNPGIEITSSFILPQKPANLCKSFLTKESGEAKIEFTSRTAKFTTENYSLFCRLIEGRFPDYTKIIPQNNPNVVVVNRSALLSVLRRISVFATANSGLLKIGLSAGCMTISSQDIDFGKMAVETLVCDYQGIPMNIGFKGASLMELLNNMESEEITMRLADASRAGVIVPTEQKENEEILMLLMPMIINE